MVFYECQVVLSYRVKRSPVSVFLLPHPTLAFLLFSGDLGHFNRDLYVCVCSSCVQVHMCHRGQGPALASCCDFLIEFLSPGLRVFLCTELSPLAL